MASDDPPREHPSRRREEGIIGPRELDYTESSRVAELEEGRFVVATDNDGTPNVDADDEIPSEEERTIEERGKFASQQMARYVSDRDADFGFALTASFEESIEQRELFSDDVATAFGDIAQWYASQVEADASPAEVLGILLLASDTDVTFPTKVLAPVLREQGLTLDDSIGDLVEALAGDGLQIPPPNEK
ncbi:hypothetical protein GL213_10100 [Halogeometricum borinquense]|uniref:Uncharacterized protein n=1 Tax=Halogeometricum borinquense TaxID=60847 RepID=A0A6C0UEF3_9EURY|nr:hypothetical protein [Halogeometricum borinquense]QIB73806.1 hypothetical protein G3I44_05575 [Halogeometricum borinquense]QIQ76836.1 hypothetical protein GL213_10100 [Halogeometricum borinquense]